MVYKDTRWTYEDYISGYHLADKRCPEERFPLPRDGDLYPRSLQDSSIHTTLCFDAEVLPASTFSIPELGPQLNHLQPIKILDSEGVYCGSIFMTSLHHSETFDVAALDLVALSTFEFHNTAGKPLPEDVENGPPLFIRHKNALWNGTMVNGLLVRAAQAASPSGFMDVAVERVAVFQIDSEVWRREITRRRVVPSTIYLC